MCDEFGTKRSGDSKDSSPARQVFYQACAATQELLTSLHRFWVGSAFRSQLCDVKHHEACAHQSELVKADWMAFEAAKGYLSKQTWHHVEGLNSDLKVLLVGAPDSFVELVSEIKTSTGPALLGERLQDLHNHLREFRDAMLDSLYLPQIHSILDGCGETCNISKNSEDGRPLKKKVNCNSLLSSQVGAGLISMPHVPPPSIPPCMQKMFTMDGRVPVISHSSIRGALGYSAGAFPAQEEPEKQWIWSFEAVEELINRAYKYTLSPGPTSLDRVKSLTEVLADLPSMVQQKWLVWGDKKMFEWWKPWMEALLLSFGARTVTSIVPNPERYVSFAPHPQLRPMTVQQATLEAPFDGIVLMGSSSAGLGRHGDALNPFADLQEAEVCYCLLRSSGILIAPPQTERDLLRWPLGRVYGPLRWPHLVANFQVLGVYEHAAILQKP